MIVAHSVGADGSEDVKHFVAISVNYNVSITLSKIDREVSCKRACGISEILLVGERLGGGEAGKDLGHWLVGERTSTGREHLKWSGQYASLL